MAGQNKNKKGEDGREVDLGLSSASGERLFSPSAARNRDVIRDTFLETMPHSGNVLEIASGTGEHAIHIAGSLAELEWYGGDPDPVSRKSLAAWISYASLANMNAPHAIDVRRLHWGNRIEKISFSGIMSANMIHIAPFEAAKGLFCGAGRVLMAQGKFFLYGPFSRNGKHISSSNEDFDRSLRGRDASWGVRDLERDILPLADKEGLKLDEVIPMPANNFSVIFSKN